MKEPIAELSIEEYSDISKLSDEDFKREAMVRIAALEFIIKILMAKTNTPLAYGGTIPRIGFKTVEDEFMDRLEKYLRKLSRPF